jgi:hypothetical protein
MDDFGRKLRRCIGFYGGPVEYWLALPVGLFEAFAAQAPQDWWR